MKYKYEILMINWMDDMFCGKWNKSV